MSEVNKKIISLEVRDEYILGSGVSIGAQGSFDSVYLRIKFDDKWLGLSIYVTWMDALGAVGDQQIVTALDLVDGQPNTYDIPVPQFATNHAGTVKLALSGYVIGGEAGKEIKSLLNTVSGAFRVLESGAVKLDGGGVNATLAEQALAAINEANRLFKEADDRLDDLDGKVGKFAEDENQRQTAEFGEGCSYNEEQGCVVDENKNPVDNSKAGRVGAELERQIAEFGAVGNKWNEDRTAIIDKDGIPVENIYAGRVGAELERQKAYTEMKSLIGDIDSAVDAILAIQLNLIGGAS